jgi:hypothetical protein
MGNVERPRRAIQPCSAAHRQGIGSFTRQTIDNVEIQQRGPGAPSNPVEFDSAANQIQMCVRILTAYEVEGERQ